MKICHIFYQQKKYGGSESYVEILEKYSKYKHRRVYVEKKYPKLPTIVNTILGFRDIAKKTVNSKKIDIIHSHFLIPGYFVQYYGGRSIVTSHCLLSEEFKLAMYDAKNWLSKLDMYTSYLVCLWLEKIMYKRLNNVIVISDFHKKELENFGSRPIKLDAPINLGLFTRCENKVKAKNKLHIPNIFTLIFLARPTYLKGLHVLIKAINTISPHYIFQLLVLGKDYQYKNGYLSYIPCVKTENNKRSAVEFQMKANAGRIIIKKEEPHRFVNKYFAAADVLVCPSLYESLGFVNMEAMASGVPVISSNAGGITEIVKDNYNGLVFQNGNHQELAVKIMSLLENPNLARKLGDNAYRFIKRFDYKKHIAQMDQIYKNVYEQT